MSGRINHAQESRGCLDIASEMRGLEQFALSDLVAKEAQVHATLALVEQQRIANLIEMSRFHHTADGEELFTNTAAAIKWRNEAGEALGLS